MSFSVIVWPDVNAFVGQVSLEFADSDTRAVKHAGGQCTVYASRFEYVAKMNHFAGPT